MYNLKDILNCTALMSAKTDEIEELFLSKYGILKRKNDLDMSGFEEFKLNRAADHGNLVKVKKYLAGMFTAKHKENVISLTLYFLTCYIGQKSELVNSCDSEMIFKHFDISALH